MCTKDTAGSAPVYDCRREQRCKKLIDHYEVEYTPFFVDRWAYVSSASDGTHHLSVFETFQDLAIAAGISVLDDGRVPVAAYDLDACQQVELHVTTPVVTRSEDQGITVDPLREEH